MCWILPQVSLLPRYSLISHLDILVWEIYQSFVLKFCGQTFPDVSEVCVVLPATLPSLKQSCN